MRNQIKVDEKFSLQTLINRLSVYAGSIARKNGSYIINSVQPGIYIRPVNQRVIPVITDLIEIIVSNSRNSQIFITAERYKEMVILQVEDTNNYNGYALGFSLQAVEKEATEAGAFVMFKNQQRRVATVSLSFSN